MLWCFLVSYFTSIGAKLWVWVLIWKTCLLRFCLSEMFRWKLISYSWSLWKNEQNHVWFAWFGGVFVNSGDRSCHRKNQSSPEKTTLHCSVFLNKFKSQPLDSLVCSYALILILKRNRQISFKWDLTVMMYWLVFLRHVALSLDRFCWAIKQRRLILIIRPRTHTLTLRLIPWLHWIIFVWLFFFWTETR
jgi:hypothetical protein